MFSTITRFSKQRMEKKSIFNLYLNSSLEEAVAYLITQNQADERRSRMLRVRVEGGSICRGWMAYVYIYIYIYICLKLIDLDEGKFEF